ncbi:beta-galactosidase family protein [Hibiscus syriacus]|uniref:Beta-galactosidase family protein n=1 Tax=Hibiscus syriacus TaxID=106335 RepID=A0A6A2ZT36_HIBSY|nr:beta-galactosidase family protein [Hibiscus syriacus]
MASSISFPSTLPSLRYKFPFPSFPISLPCQCPNSTSAYALLPLRFAAKSQAGGPVEKPRNKKMRKGKSDDALNVLRVRDVEIVGANDDVHQGLASTSSTTSTMRSLAYHPQSLPKPPAGFAVDNAGKILKVSNKRIDIIVDSVNNNPLECVIRRVFKSSRGDECMLLCPVDMPVQILKSTNIDGWSAVSDEEVEAILPTAAYALAKIHMHLVHSGFCYTARGGFCYSEDNIFDFRTGNLYLSSVLCFCFWLSMISIIRFDWTLSKLLSHSGNSFSF